MSPFGGYQPHERLRGMVADDIPALWKLHLNLIVHGVILLVVDLH